MVEYLKNEITQNIFIINSQLIEKKYFNHFLNYNEGVVIYEVIRLVNGIPLFIEEHIMRLHYSANLMGLKINTSDSEIIASIKELSRENQLGKGNVKLVFQFKNNELTFFICFFIRHSYPTELQYKNGVKVKLMPTERQNPNAKVVNLDYRGKTESFVNENLIYEVLLVNKNGWITEGSKSNVFFIKKNLVFTAPRSMVLAGITRKYVLMLAHFANIEIIEECININDLQQFDAVFISGTSPKILPISSVENVNYDVENSVLRKIMNDYNLEVEKYILRNALK